MEQLLRKVKERRDLTGARMVAGAVRNKFQSAPDKTLTALLNWTENSDAIVRIAAGLALGAVTIRNTDSLAAVMPYVERLANDRSQEVRSFGAAGALETIWLYHYDEIWIVVEDWVERKNDLIRKTVIETMGRIVKEDKIGRPSTLKQFIERGMRIADHLLTSGSPELRPMLALTVNEFGLKAPDLISPWIREWASRSDLNSLSLAKELLEQPFGTQCRDIDKGYILGRIAEIEAEMVSRISGWMRQGKGRVEYFTIIVDRLLSPENDPCPPYDCWADPYRGCQFRCEFCATRDLAEFAGDTEDDLVRRVVVVANAAEILAREIGGERWQGRPNPVVKLGNLSDPYQSAEEKFQVTREMLKVFLEHESPVVIETRSENVLRDLDVLEKLAEKGLVNVLFSIPTPIEGILKKLEPGGASVSERLRSIAMLSKKGVPVGLSLSPVIPKLTDHPEPLEELIRRSAEAGAAFVVPRILTMKGSARPKFRFFLETFIPTLESFYKELYRGAREGEYSDEEYVRELTGKVIPGLAEKYGANRTGLMLAGSHTLEESCLGS